MSKDIRVAIVCDWLTGLGGAERVVLALHHMFPEAPIYTSQYDRYKITWFKDADVRTTGLQKLPKRLKKFLPVLRAKAFRKLDLSQYDLVISASGAEAKAVKTRPDALHICYCHSPTHYYWMRYEQYLEHPGFGWLDPLARLGLKLLLKPMRKLDYQAAQQPTVLIANSHFTAANIKKYYNRESTVIHPPVDIERFKSSDMPARAGFVVTGRQTPYKRIDLAVEACTSLKVPLVVIGNGPDHSRLEKLAGQNITFLTHVSDEELPKHLQSANAFIFPGVDDFGIAAVEAMAAGTPVIAYHAGGALDYVQSGKTGEFFDDSTVSSLIKVLEKFNPVLYNNKIISEFATTFSEDRFAQQMKQLIAEQVKKKEA